MEEKLIKSESNFAFHMDGENYIDAEVLSNIIKDIADLTKIAAKSEDPEAYLKMNVTAFKNGSFQIDFSAICENCETIFNLAKDGAGFAVTLVTIIEGFFKIKKHLKGETPKKIEELDNNKIQITNNEDSNITVIKSSDIILNNSTVDQLIINISDNVHKHNPRGGFSIERDGDVCYFDNEDMKNLSKPISTTEINSYKEVTLRADLPIKKADLLGNSVWNFIYRNRVINATIEDEDFMEKVHFGKISVHAGDYITADIKIICQIDSDGNPMEDTLKYNVVKVVGDIKNDIKYRQFNINEQ